MTLTIQHVRYGNESELSGYLAYPTRAARPLPAILLIQEAWGVDDHIEELARRFALAGYAVLAPELYARGGTHPEPLTRHRCAEMKAFVDTLPPGTLMDAAVREAALAERPEPVATRLRASLAAMFAAVGQVDRNLVPLVEGTRFLRRTFEVTRGQKVASVGFCMGGALSARLAAADPELAGAVVFYGMAPPEADVARIQCPVLGFYGSLDARVNAGLPGLTAAMAQHGRRFEHHLYEGAQHAFFNDTRPSYHVGAARDAFARTLAFFRTELTGG
jgi:carboxymethylenebutenolidase